MPGVSLSAIVVNYRRRDLLAMCLRSISDALDRLEEPSEIVVVDNGSGDGSADLVRARHPDAALVALGENVGFPGGVNRGLERARGEWILLLNNDATLEPDAPRQLMAAARGSADVGSVACQLRFAGSTVLNSAGLGIDRLGVAYDRLLGRQASASEDRPVEVFGASGGAALYRRAMLDELGGFDESFFAYLEDADLAWRARMRGWRCVYAPEAVAHHLYSATSGHGSDFKYLHAGQNRMRLLAKNAHTRDLLRYAPAILLYDLAYVAGVGVRDRTLAPLRGRMRGLREWRSYRRMGEPRRRVDLAPARGVRGGLARRDTWRRHAGPAPR